MTPIVLYPGSPAYATLADGALLRLDVTGLLWRDGFQFKPGTVAFAAAAVGVYGSVLVARGKTDGKLWLSVKVDPALYPAGWADITNGTIVNVSGPRSVATLDPDFLAQLMKDGPDEPL